MAIDYYIALECEPKRHFGDGDCPRGAVEILEALKSKNRAAAFRQMAAKTGRAAETLTVTLHVHDKDGNPIEKKATLVELEQEAAKLDAKAGFCVGCPANFLRRPYGCFAAINYPIPEAGEKWLISRIQPDTLGALLCLDFMTEFKIKGDGVRNLRHSGFFESKNTPVVTVKKGFLSRQTVTADQVLETLLRAGSSLSPGHCFGILLWLNAINVTDPQASDPAVQHAELELGPPPDSEAVDVFQTLVKALYNSWRLGVPLIISA